MRPYYLKLFVVGSPYHRNEWLAHLRRAARQLESHDVRLLLSCDWREMSVGAWFAVLKGDPALADDIAHALLQSRGTLSSIDLLVAGVLVSGPTTPPTIAAFYRSKVTDHDTNAQYEAGMALAAAEYLARHERTDSGLPTPSHQHRESFAELVSLAEQVRAGGTSRRAPYWAWHARDLVGLLLKRD